MKKFLLALSVLVLAFTASGCDLLNKLEEAPVVEEYVPYIPVELTELFNDAVIHSLDDNTAEMEGDTFRGHGVIVMLEADFAYLMVVVTTTDLLIMIDVSYEEHVFGDTDYWIDSINVLDVSRDISRSIEFESEYYYGDPTPLELAPLEFCELLGSMTVEDYYALLEEINFFDYIVLGD